MNIRVFCHNEYKLIRRNAPSAKDLALQHATQFEQEVLAVQGTPEFTFEINSLEIDDRAQLHCEKWVEEIGRHFFRYARYGRRPQLKYLSGARKKERVQKIKSFSGDVSGTIGEALFSTLLVKHFGLPDSSFAHLRSISNEIYPDFIICTPTPSLANRMKWRSSSRYKGTLSFPAEVKAVIKPSKGLMKDRLEDAIEQVRRYWNFPVQMRGGPALICLAIRNPDRQSYDLGLIWGW